MLTENEKQLIHAARQGLKAEVDRLINDGTDVNADHGQALISALENRHQEVIELLLEKGARTDLATSGEILPAAVRSGRTKNVQSIFKQAADGHYHTVSNWEEALAIAVNYGYAEIAALLLDLGTDPDTRNRAAAARDASKKGEPLFSAVQSRNVAMVKLLLEHGARPDLRKDTIPLAIKNDDQEVLDLLSSIGADALKL
jgi:ankyrin repeat protein